MCASAFIRFALHVGLTDEGLMPVPGLHSRWVMLGNGEKAHYVTSGETGPAVILVHGGVAGGSGTAGWQFMAPFLGANGFRVYCPDLPGFGLADTREEFWPRMGVADHADFIDRFATALCIDEFCIGGNSSGAGVAAQVLMNQPLKVIRVFYIAGGIADLFDMPAPPRGAKPPINLESSAEAIRENLQKILLNTDAITDDLIEMRARASARQVEPYRVHNEANYAVMYGEQWIVQKVSARHRLPSIDTPQIYLFGADDALIPADRIGYAQEDALPNVQFFYPPDTGHQGQTDRPDLFNQVVLEFLRDGKVSAPTAAEAGVSTRRPVLEHLVETG